MCADRPKPDRPSAIKFKLSDLELENVVGGSSAKTFPANTNHLDPYKSFNFRVTFG
jgi:hypothetical protein